MHLLAVPGMCCFEFYCCPAIPISHSTCPKPSPTWSQLLTRVSLHSDQQFRNTLKYKILLSCLPLRNHHAGVVPTTFQSFIAIVSVVSVVCIVLYCSLEEYTGETNKQTNTDTCSHLHSHFYLQTLFVSSQSLVVSGFATKCEDLLVV